jgi:hypothetical protein
VRRRTLHSRNEERAVGGGECHTLGVDEHLSPLEGPSGAVLHDAGDPEGATRGLCSRGVRGGVRESQRHAERAGCSANRGMPTRRREHAPE